MTAVVTNRIGKRFVFLLNTLTQQKNLFYFCRSRLDGGKTAAEEQWFVAEIASYENDNL